MQVQCIGNRTPFFQPLAYKVIDHLGYRLQFLASQMCDKIHLLQVVKNFKIPFRKWGPWCRLAELILNSSRRTITLILLIFFTFPALTASVIAATVIVSIMCFVVIFESRVNLNFFDLVDFFARIVQ